MKVRKSNRTDEELLELCEYWISRTGNNALGHSGIGADLRVMASELKRRIVLNKLELEVEALREKNREICRVLKARGGLEPEPEKFIESVLKEAMPALAEDETDNNNKPIPKEGP